MANRDWKTLTEDFLREYGINGGSFGSGDLSDLSSVATDVARAARWIFEANNHVCSMWTNWNFLWVLADAATVSVSGSVNTGSSATPLDFDRDSFYLEYGTDDRRKLTFMEWDRFRHQFSGAIETAVPSIITSRPDGVMVTDTVPEATTDLTFEFWKVPSQLEIDAGTTDIPEQYEDILLYYAAMSYGDWIDAPEILEGAQAKYFTLLDKMERQQLPGRRTEAMSAADGDGLVVAVPGQDSLTHVTR